MDDRKTICPECGAEPSSFVINADGHEVCSGCGLIQAGCGAMVDAPRYREDADDAPPPRIESASVAIQKRALGRASRRHRHVPSKERWIQRLRDMAVRAELSRGISETATLIYRRATDMPEWKNRKHDYQVGLLVACLFHSCNIHRAHRTPSELCAVLGVDPRNVRRMVKVLERAAGDVDRRPRGTDVPYEVLPRCAYRIENVPMDKLGTVRKLAKTFYEAVRADVDNHRPDTITAGLLSVVLRRAGISVDDSDIAEACLVAPNTVRSISGRIATLLEAKRL